MALYIFLLIIAACGKEKKQVEENVILITTIPLYYERVLYDGSLPLCFLDGDLMIPLAVISFDDSELQKDYNNDALDYCFDISHTFIYIYKFGAWFFPYEELNELGDYDCFYYEDENEKQISIRKGTEAFDYSWTSGRIVTHGMGAIDEFQYTNSLDAFMYNYELGCTVFEVDMCLNSRGELLCLHDFGKYESYFGISDEDDKKPEDYSKEEFLSMKICGRYTTLAIEGLLQIMYESPDVYIVTDTKSESREDIEREFGDIIDAAYALGLTEVLDRIIPQIHNQDMYRQIMNIYPWKSIIYTSYYLVGDEYSEKEMFDFAYDNGIKVITLFKGRGTPSFLKQCEKYGIKTYVHTYNTEEERKELHEQGFYGLYSDCLLPE